MPRRAASIGYQTPVPKVFVPALAACGCAIPTSLGEPWIETAVCGTAMTTLNAVPVCFWQVLQ
jgi:hypothetical protein